MWVNTVNYEDCLVHFRFAILMCEITSEYFIYRIQHCFDCKNYRSLLICAVKVSKYTYSDDEAALEGQVKESAKLFNTVSTTKLSFTLNIRSKSAQLYAFNDKKALEGQIKSSAKLSNTISTTKLEFTFKSRN